MCTNLILNLTSNVKSHDCLHSSYTAVKSYGIEDYIDGIVRSL
jgi:hypothetical protein